MSDITMWRPFSSTGISAETAKVQPTKGRVVKKYVLRPEAEHVEDVLEVTLLSERSLKDWDSPEEDAAWAHFQKR